MMKGSPPTLDDYTLIDLTQDEEPQIEALLQRCTDYLEQVSGMKPSRELARDLLTALPPGKKREDKRLLGVFAEGGELVGLLDIVRNYSVPRVRFLGLLLLEPAQRGQGLGGSSLELLRGGHWLLGQRKSTFRSLSRMKPPFASGDGSVFSNWSDSLQNCLGRKKASSSS